MKKVMKCMALMALVALAFTSCKKTEEKSTVMARTQQLVMDGVDEDRAYLDPNDLITWEAGDLIMIFNISKADPSDSDCATYEATESGTYVPFDYYYGEVSHNKKDDAYYAYYPAGPDRIVTNLVGGENKAKFFVSPTQTYRPNMVSMRDMYMAAKSEADHLDTDIEFMFNNVCGVLKMKPYEAAKRTVTKIEYEDDIFTMSGWAEVIIPNVDQDELNALLNSAANTPAWFAQCAAYRSSIGFNVTGTPEEKGKKITLNVPGGVTLGDSKDNTPVFYMVLRPCAMLNGGVMTFTFDDGTTKVINLPANPHLMQKSNHVVKLNLNMDNF